MDHIEGVCALVLALNRKGGDCNVGVCGGDWTAVGAEAVCVLALPTSDGGDGGDAEDAEAELDFTFL